MNITGKGVLITGGSSGIGLALARVLNAGYQSRSSFTRAFRRYYGSDPSEYRANAQRASSDSVTTAEDEIKESDAA